MIVRGEIFYIVFYFFLMLLFRNSKKWNGFYDEVFIVFIICGIKFNVLCCWKYVIFCRIICFFMGF